MIPKESKALDKFRIELNKIFAQSVYYELGEINLTKPGERRFNKAYSEFKEIFKK